MSSLGITTSQMTPEYLQNLQQQQDYQRKMAMAQSLMGNQQQGQNGGLANIGSDILGAVMANNAKHEADPQTQVMAQRYGMSNSDAARITNPSFLSKVGGLFNLGGS